MGIGTDEIDQLLLHRLELQRYTAHVVQEAFKALKTIDRAMIALIDELVSGASQAVLSQLSQLSGSHPRVKTFLNELNRLLDQAQEQVQALVLDPVAELVQGELETIGAIVATAAASALATRTVAAMLIQGNKQVDMIGNVFAQYGQRLRAELAIAAGSDPERMRRLVRGTRTNQYSDGLLYWRNNRLLEPTIDVIVSGNSANAAQYVYQEAGTKQVIYLATLDFRTCVRCRAAEIGGPYPLNRHPPVPAHPRCRCVVTPYVEGALERPYVNDDRSVKNIPKGERPGRIGQTRKGMAAWFDNLSHADQARAIGPTRAALWRDGTVTNLEDLINQHTGRPLTVEQIRRAA